MTDQELIARVRELQKPSRIVPLSELATIAPLLASALERALAEVERWKTWSEYAQRRFTEATGQDLQASQ